MSPTEKGSSFSPLLERVSRQKHRTWCFSRYDRRCVTLTNDLTPEARVIEHTLSWIVPIAIVALYVAWGLGFQARNPEAGGDV